MSKKYCVVLVCAIIVLTNPVVDSASVYGDTAGVVNGQCNKSVNPGISMHLPGQAASIDPSIPRNWLSTVLEDIKKSEYHYTSKNNIEWSAPNRAQNLRSRISGQSFEVSSRSGGEDWLVGIKLNAIGREGGLTPVLSPQITVEGNRLNLHRGDITEWYLNSEKGIEQGFVISDPPQSGVLDSDVVIDMTVSGELIMAYTGDHNTVCFHDSAGNKKLHYGNLHVYDSRGRELDSGIMLKNDHLQLYFDDTGIEYPVYIDPLMTLPAWSAEGNKILASFGCSVATAGDVNGDGYSDVIVGAEYYDNRESGEGRAYVYHGSGSGLNTSPAWITEGNQVDASYGTSVASAGDVNGDGYSDVIVGAYGYDNGETGEGRAYVYYGSSTGLSPTADWIGESNKSGAIFGVSVSTAGDVNGDGYSDIIIGASNYENGEIREGMAFVYYGSGSGILASPAWSAESNQEGASFGVSVSTAGDANGDGYSDVIVGARNYENGEVVEGAAFVYLGSGTGLDTVPAWTGEGNRDNSSFGIHVACAGDVNGDGYSDIIVGATSYTNGERNEGMAFLYQGSATGPETIAAWTGEGNQDVAFYGCSVGTAGDVNGDGYSDVIVGARWYDTDFAGEGKVYVYLGSGSGLEPIPYWTAVGHVEGAYFGCSAATAGDVNGDGYSDVIVGAYGYANPDALEGAAFVFHGSADGLADSSAWSYHSGTAGAQFGISVHTAGDLNGDGYSDIIIGASNYSNGESGEGKAFVFHGSATGPVLTPSWAVESNVAGASFGNSVSTAGDVNGDGYSDVIIGAYKYTNAYFSEGKAYVYHGSPSGLELLPAWTAVGNQMVAIFGNSVSTAGDVNGDGYSDVIVGSVWYDHFESDEGMVFVYHGSAAGLGSSPAWTAESNQTGAEFGISVNTAGDVNGDGYSDVIIGADEYDNGQSDEGGAFVYHGSASGLETAPAWSTESNQSLAYMGYSVASAGDVNGDGYSDVIVGTIHFANGQTHEGEARVFHGSAAGLLSSAAWTAEGNQDFAQMGMSVSSAGDVNGDGYSDVIVGVYEYDNGSTDEGCAYVYHGSASGLDSAYSWMGESNQGEANFGRSVSCAGDVNGDGFSDVIAGAHMYDNTENNEGQAFVYYGNDGDGLDRIPRQARVLADVPVDILCASDVASAFRLKALGRSPMGRGNVKLEWEVKCLGVPFDGTGLRKSSWINTGAPVLLAGSAVPITVLADSLPPGGPVYHWRLRILTDSPFFPRSPWFSMPYNNITETDIRKGSGTIPTPTPTSSLLATDTPYPTFTSTPRFTNTPLPTNTPSPAPSSTYTPTYRPTHTKVPTNTPLLTSTPTKTLTIPVDSGTSVFMFILILTIILCYRIYINGVRS